MSKMKTSLYNSDGSLCSEAQLLLSIDLKSFSTEEEKKAARKLLDEFRAKLSKEDVKEFQRLKKCIRNIKWRAENPRYNATWRAENPEKVKDNNATWRAENPEKFKEQKRKERSTPHDKLRRIVHRAFKRIGQNKPTDTLKLLGCTWEEARAHIENLFQEGMTWENHGRGDGKWQIDHIRPVASFKGASEEELKQMNHISNLQPLWTADNLSKSDKWDGELNSEILNSEV
jgi:DNA-nicking Smr family endonuclease